MDCNSKERLVKLEVKIEGLEKDNHQLHETNKRLKIEVYVLKRKLFLISWIMASWKHFWTFISVFVFIVYIIGIMADLTVDTKATRQWVKEKILPWATQRIQD